MADTRTVVGGGGDFVGKYVHNSAFWCILAGKKFIYLLKLSKRATIRSVIQLYKGAAFQANKGRMIATYMKPIKQKHRNNKNTVSYILA
jgi:hypothetical protein